MRIWGKLTLDLATCVIIGFSLYSLSASSSSSLFFPEGGTPTDVPSRSIGFYSAGCIAGAETLALDGAGYQVMRPSRNRFYGHNRLVHFIQDFSKLYSEITPHSGLLLGDLGLPHGGPMPYGHASHQTGLDVDVWFWTHPEQSTRSLTLDEREKLPMPSVLDDTGEVDPSKFLPSDVTKLKLASLDDRVQRIFVNIAIKRYLCKNLTPAEHGWLRKLRPWPGHDDHFHVRLYCAPGDFDCVTQDPIPEGDGCDAAINPPPGPVVTPTPAPGVCIMLPKACDEILGPDTTGTRCATDFCN